MTALRQRMVEDMQIRNFSPQTISAYVRAVAGFAQHFGRSPELLGLEEIREYQVWLRNSKKLAWSSYNVIVCGLRFFYKHTLGQQIDINHIPFPRKPKELPVVLSREELVVFFDAIDNTKHRTVLQTMYASGLRISEAVALRVEDIDSKRMVIRVRQGKGQKDRYTILTPTLLETLRSYWRMYRPASWLFPGESLDQPLSRKTVDRAARKARTKAGIKKRLTTHTMRHCFATHLLEAGTDLCTIQHLLGHSSLRTTAVYLHVAIGAEQSSQKAVDLLHLAHTATR